MPENKEYIQLKTTLTDSRCDMKVSTISHHTERHKHGTWPAIDGEAPDIERQFNHQYMPRLQDIRLPKAANQEELESGSRDGAKHVDKSHKE